MLNKYNQTIEECSMCSDQCVYGCPMFSTQRTTTVYPSRKVYLARCIAKDEIKSDVSILDALYQCCSCRLCETFCVYGIKGKPRNPAFILEQARYEVIQKGIKPDYVRDIESVINNTGNLYGDLLKELVELKNVNIAGKDSGIIYLVDTETLALSPEIPLAAVKLMNKKDIKPVISDFIETGYDLKAIGFLEEATLIARKMTDYLNKSSASKIVISSPKDYYALTEWYKELGLAIKKEIILETDFFYNLFIIHCSEYKKRPDVLQNFIKLDKLAVYHDGSFMARYLKKYDSPRMLIKPLFTRYEELRTNREEARPLAPAVYPLGISENILKKMAKLRIVDIEQIKPDYVVTSDAQSYAALKKYWYKEKVLSIPEALLMNYVKMDK